MLFAGVDEAGRGPIIGPMVMVLYVIREEDLDKLKMLGVKDSKLLSRKKREELYDDVLDIAADCKIKILSNDVIDDALTASDMNLNLLELNTTAELINQDFLEKVYIDCPSANKKKYETSLRRKLMNKEARLVVDFKADLNYPIVAAASIVAKVTRDREIEKLKKKFGVDFGSGYLGDHHTRTFLESHFRSYPFFRKTWKPWKELEEKKKQLDLSGFTQDHGS